MGAMGVFTTTFTILLLLAIFVPIFNIAFNTTETTSNNFVSTIQGTSYISLLANIILLPFVTFGLPSIFNWILIIPRILMAISVYYIVSPAKS